jgi:hypothetical protein
VIGGEVLPARDAHALRSGVDELYIFLATDARRLVVNDETERPDLPKGSVEILPPEDDERGSGFIYSRSGGTVKVYKLGPVSGALVGLGLLLLTIFGVLFLGGALLLILPVAALLTAGAVVSGILQNPFKRLR